MPRDLGRYARTVASLPPAQVAHRVRLRAQRKLLARQPERLAVRWAVKTDGAPGWPATFVPVDSVAFEPEPEADPLDLAAGRFSLIGERHDVSVGGWRPTERSQLFRYHLHYFEWAWAFVHHPDREWARQSFASLWRSWGSGTRYGRWDEWSPYVVSLRVWVLCAVFHDLVEGSELEDEVRRSIGAHAGYLAANLELDVGGNHLLKNLKALVGAGVFLGNDDLLRRASHLLRRELRVQVLADGGHFERSPSYHAQVLGDLADCHGLLAASGRPEVPDLGAAVDRMRSWLGVMLGDHGDVPLFGDCAAVGPRRLAALGVQREAGARLRVLSESGYVVCRPDPHIQVIIDVGPPCPPQLPAHAQAGCLAFLAFLDGEAVVLDTGTSTYVGGRRAVERSTAAHNTVTVDGENQSEVWGSFRCGRRARPTLIRAVDMGDRLLVEAEHDGYRFLPGRPVHRRTFEVSAAGLTLTDTLSGAGHHVIESRVHRPAASTASVEIAHAAIDGRHVPAAEEDALVSSGFGHLEPAVVSTIRHEGELPMELVTRLEFRRRTNGDKEVTA